MKKVKSIPLEDSPLVSVVIPAYNAEEYIEETLQSVLTQTYKNIEVIVVDDGSTDRTLQIINKYKSDLMLITQKNKGVSVARNTAVDKAMGEWIAFIDADDIWFPKKIAEQVSQMGSENWSHTNSLYFGYNQDGNTKRSDLTPQFGGHVFEKLLTDNFITTSTVLIKKKTFLQYGKFDVSLKALEDWKLWLEISLEENLNYQQLVLCKYRITPGSASRNARDVLPLHIQLINQVFDKNKNIIQHQNQLKSKALQNSYKICSYIAEDSKDYVFSFTCALNALRGNKYRAASIRRLIRTLLNLVLIKPS